MQQIKDDIKQNTFRQIYLLYGEERYLIRQYANNLRRALCSEDDSMNTHIYNGKDVPVGEIIDLAETMPFLAQRRVFIISDSGLFKSGGERLAEYLSAPGETAYFIFSESEVDKRSKLFKTVQSEGRAVEFSALDEQRLKSWIAGILGKEGKKITENTAQLFLQKTGNDMANIRMELEKLICYCLDREIVTSEDVEAVCTTRISDHIFGMVNAIAEGRKYQALQLYYDLLALKVKPMTILPLIAKECNRLLLVKDMRTRGYDKNAIAKKIAVTDKVAGIYINRAGRFKTSALRAAVEQCVETEEAVKTGRMDPMMSVEILMMTVLQNT